MPFTPGAEATDQEALTDAGRMAAIVGAGPAGAAVSETLSAAGVAHDLFDEQPRAGGNIGRRRFAAPEAPPEGVPLCRLHAGARVLRVSPLREVEWDDGARLNRRRYDAVFLCAGAYDGMLPREPRHETWSSAGALQALLKGQGVVPEGRVLIAGAGPFLHVVAADLARAGARIVAVADALPLSAYARLLPHARWDGVKTMFAAQAAMRRAGTSVRFGARIARLGRDTATLHDGRTIAFDRVGVSDFFAPQTQLARTAGCAQTWSATGRYYCTPVDSDCRSSVSGVFVCGEGAGVRGGPHARLSGLVAARAFLGMERAGLQRRVRRLARFGAALEAAMAACESRPADDTIACACERVPVAGVRQAVAQGLEDLSSIKVVTRCGMGPCQGRYCEPVVGRLIAETGRAPRAPLNQKALARPLGVKELIGG
jgi:NADPH-dependent 2,4-dienoyl-CoA reductase/sulfur reductase-like enzyme